MPPCRYPGACTLPDGKVLVVGGVKQSGAAGYAARDKSKDNPTYEIYDPKARRFGGDKQDMKSQLSYAL